MEKRSPRVSIGLPVYNGAEFVGEAIDSLLAQTFEDIELVVSDNGSTDGTVDICRERAARDPRVRFSAGETNRGSMWNFNHVFELSRGEYFKWAAHDDVHDPRYVERCVEILDRNADVALVFPRTRDVDENGKEIRVKQHALNSDSEDVTVRFGELIRFDYTCEPIFGVTRADILRRTPLIEEFSDSDRVLLAEIGLYGRCVEVPEYLFIHREHSKRSVRLFKSRQTRNAFNNPEQAGKAVFPYTRELWALLRALRRAPISSRQRMVCYRHMARWMVRYSPDLLEDYTYAATLLLRPIKHRIFPNGGGGSKGVVA